MNFLPLHKNQSLSNENLIKLRHQLEDNVKSFFDLLSASETRELELAIAKLLDFTNSLNDHQRKQDFLFKIGLIQSYHLLRQNGDRSLKKMKRLFQYRQSLTVNILLHPVLPKELSIDAIPKDDELLEFARKYST